MSKLVLRQYAPFIPRPAFSCKIREHLEELIYQKILLPCKIIIGGKFEIWLHLSFADYYTLENDRVFVAYKPTTFMKEQIKTYFTSLNYAIILQSSNRRLTYIQLIVEALELFFNRFYKKVKQEDLERFKAKIDYDYLMALPYPAPFEEQQYVMDDSLNMQQFMQDTPHLLNLPVEM
jgi:hypothetical protein